CGVAQILDRGPTKKHGLVSEFNAFSSRNNVGKR
ncbi:MAG: hypothetical protein ACI87A_002454, partial [Planctomycetota bacterium]